MASEFLNKIKGKKYKGIVNSLFTNSDGTVNSSGLQHMLEYSLLTPEKVGKIGKYLNELADQNIKNKKKNKLEIISIAYKELIQGCHADLPLFSEYVLDLCNSLLQHQQSDFKIIGVETFEKFAKYGGTKHGGEKFIPYFLEMAQSSDKDEVTQHKLKVYGLRGLYSYISNVGDFDNFIAKFVTEIDKSSGMISIFLDNMKSLSSKNEKKKKNKDKNNNNEENNVMEIEENMFELPCEEVDLCNASTLCLLVITSRLNSITITPILSNIFNYLDNSQDSSWKSPFAIKCIETVNEGIQPQLHYNLIRIL
eukprot:TRINITY_DN3183_c0_g1_i1.p1 TRINITY_DN3183_c0_g1~~TRINITY_DN3183_c0_g1_i1.p1  ORF type:complete len:309 (+),score=68.99 TRINITY_DN3183_c0_g1_i1:93-1019(+)